MLPSPLFKSRYSAPECSIYRGRAARRFSRFALYYAVTFFFQAVYVVFGLAVLGGVIGDKLGADVAAAYGKLAYAVELCARLREYDGLAVFVLYFVAGDNAVRMTVKHCINAARAADDICGSIRRGGFVYAEMRKKNAVIHIFGSDLVNGVLNDFIKLAALFTG